MENLKYLLPVIILYPIIINKLANHRSRLNFLLLFGPIATLGFSILTFWNGQPMQLDLGNISSYFSLGFSLDILSGLIASTVLAIGLIVQIFSLRYLEDDPNKEKFLKHLSYTLCCVLSMLLAPNLVLLYLSWVGTSYFLHHLLTHFSNRIEANKAAHQKFWVSRFGDLFIISTGLVLLLTFNSLEFEVIFKKLQSQAFLDENSLFINLASIFLVLGAMTKSAQFPFHYWLPNTMETPTPVSAIMHAGIINAGGYLVIRMSPLLTEASISLSLLAVIGGFTAFWATLIMFTQTNVKKSLAYSTISQMGFMMLQCGLGAFSIATVHIIGHAFYKAYAFLSSGTAADFGKLNRYFPKPKLEQSLWAPFISAFFSLSTIFGGIIYLGYNLSNRPGVIVLLVILSLAVSQIILSSQDRLKSTVSAFTLIILYTALSSGMDFLLSDTVISNFNNNDLSGKIALVICTGFFIALYFIQNSLHKISLTEFGKKIYVKALRGSLT